MASIRVLIVDDSVVIRKVLCEALRVDGSIDVAGTAADGRIALAKIQQLNPDLVTLDVEMPVISGLETLTEIRSTFGGNIFVRSRKAGCGSTTASNNACRFRG